jgi:hypothetical protein
VLDRRRLIKGTVLGACTASVVFGQPSRAQELTPFNESDSLARSLDYHADGKTVDVREYPEYGATQSCAVCTHLISAADGLYGCKLAPGKAVVPGGWCKLWAPKT